MAVRIGAGVQAERPVLSRARPRELSILSLLTWAFRDECAQLAREDLDAVRGERPGVGTEWRLMERGRVGCEIDGGGRSEPHDDADTVAEAVARLPVALGGWPMALRVAELARAGRVPDTLHDVRVRCSPVSWHINPHGRRGATAPARGFEGGWPDTVRRTRRGGIKREPSMCTPVVFTPSPAQIGAARRAWLHWRCALLELRAVLSRPGLLECHRITEAMPPVAPWRERG